MPSERIDRFEEIWADFQEARMGGLQRQPGNPFGIEFQRFGRARALKAQGMNSPWFNRVINLNQEHEAILDEVLGFYGDQGIRPVVEVPENGMPDPITGLLSRRGLARSGTQAVLCGRPSAEPPGYPAGVTVREVCLDEMETFLDILLEGMGYAVREPMKPNMLFWHGSPGWRLYMAFVGTVPAAAGVLFTREDVGYLATSATVPAMRGMGAHQALIRRRMTAAAQAGCTVVTGQAAHGSTSHQNMERAGLRLAYCKSIWSSPGH